MGNLKISCRACGRAWKVACPYSVYERQAVESSPCPFCGAYTLCCRAPDEAPPRPPPGPRRSWPGLPVRPAGDAPAPGAPPPAP